MLEADCGQVYETKIPGRGGHNYQGVPTLSWVLSPGVLADSHSELEKNSLCFWNGSHLDICQNTYINKTCPQETQFNQSLKCLSRFDQTLMNMGKGKYQTQLVQALLVEEGKDPTLAHSSHGGPPKGGGKGLRSMREV